MEQLQHRIGGRELAAEHGNRFTAMPHPLAVEQNRPVVEVETALAQIPAQPVVGATIADLQVWDSPQEFTAQGEMAAERAAAVVDEDQGHPAILTAEAGCR